MPFRIKKLFLDKASVAEQLKSTRLKKGWTLAEIASASNVRQVYLEALERGDYRSLPAGIYALNYLREYAAVLDLDYEKLLRKFKEEQLVYQSGGQKNLFARQTVKAKYFVAVPNVIKYSFISLVAFISLIYLWFLVQNTFVAPKLTVFSPAEDLVTGKNTLIVAGQTDPETEILINDRQAVVSETGEFSEQVNLRSGINLITVVAQKGAKKKNIISREVLFKNSIINP